MGAGYQVRAKAADAAEILIYEDIGESFLMGGVSAKQFAADLKSLGKVRTIDLRMNSNGGDVFDGMAIYQQLVQHPATITTHIDGLAASISSVIAMAGSKIRIAESGFLMIHEAWGMGVGGSDDLRALANLLEVTTATMGDVYAARTRNSSAKIKGWMEAETWFTGKDAVANGFADEIAENMRVAAHVDPERYKYRHVPGVLAGRPEFDARMARLNARKIAA